MNLHLTPEVEELVQSRLKSGRYNSASEVVREALGLMEERDQILSARKDEVQGKIAEGLRSLRLGNGVDGEAVFDRIEGEIDALDRNGHR